MPEGCNFLCCQRLASYTWYGYCTEAHYKRAIRDPEAKEKVEQRQFDEMIAFFKLMEEDTEPKETKSKETKPQGPKPKERQRSKSY